MERNCEFLIIGQGVAGSLLCQELLDAGKSVLVVDNSHEFAASKIAAGIINPITGRRFVKSWLIDDLLPFAEKRFSSIAKLLNQPNYFSHKQILRCLFSQVEETEWLIRTAQDGWSKYVLEANDLGEFKGHIVDCKSQGVLLGAQVDLPRFVEDYRLFLKSKDLLIENKFDARLFLENESDKEKSIAIGNISLKFDKIIFCEGSSARYNPLWNMIPFEPAKGEVFHLRIPGLSTDRLLKHKMMMAPLGNELYWFGANYEWNAKTEEPSKEGKRFLQKRLDKMLPNYEIVNHVAATRPTIKDRRPVIGAHPEKVDCFILNGLGTKGASLGPYMASMMRKFLLEGESVLSEVSLNRFLKQQEV